MRASRTRARASQITFHGLKPSEELRREIGDRINWLEQFYPQLMSCRVRLQVPHRHRGHGRHMHVHIEMTVPGRPPLLITHEPSLQPSLKDAAAPVTRKRDEIAALHRYARVAIREAFDAARRRLQDVDGERRADLKRPVAARILAFR